jgi:hypothetical protein
LERISPQASSQLAVIGWIDQIQQCYEIASDLGLLYLQQQDKQHTMNAITSTLGGTYDKLHTRISIDYENNHLLFAGGSYSPQPTTHQQTQLSLLVETAILRCPIFLIEHGRLAEAIAFYRFLFECFFFLKVLAVFVNTVPNFRVFLFDRNMLSAVEASGAHAIRLTLCRQLAELLLRGLTGLSYTPPPG